MYDIISNILYHTWYHKYCIIIMYDIISNIWYHTWYCMISCIISYLIYDIIHDIINISGYAIMYDIILLYDIMYDTISNIWYHTWYHKYLRVEKCRLVWQKALLPSFYWKGVPGRASSQACNQMQCVQMICSLHQRSLSIHLQIPHNSSMVGLRCGFSGFIASACHCVQSVI